MKTNALLATLGSLLLLGSCVFESPFEKEAKIAVDPTLIGRWEQVSDDAKRAPERMLVLKHSDNEYLVEYPMGEKAMFFRAFAVELAGAEFIQIQLIGTADGPVKPGNRKYHLVKVTVKGDSMEMATIDPDLIGREHADPTQMKAAFNEHKDDPKLFGKPEKFRRLP
jgi:hypothetical protein